MGNKYIRLIKKSCIFLSILLVAVCFLLGSSYSNFVYKLDNHRAVEMIVSGLDYKVKINNEEINNLEIKPGLNIFNVEIKSVNEVDSYFKFLINKDIDAFYVDEKPEGIIKENEIKSFNIVVFNNNDKEITSYYDVASGYINNKLSDIIIPNNYKEIENNFNVFSSVKLSNNDSIFKLLSFNHSKLEIILEKSIYVNKIKGARGYIDWEETLNNELKTYSNYNIRNVSLDDIRSYTGNNLISFKEKEVLNTNYFFIPFKNENYYIVDTKVLSNEIIVNNKTTSKYDEVFFNCDYTLTDTYSKENVNDVEWGVISIKEGNVVTSKLYDSNNREYEQTVYIKPIISFTNSVKIEFDKEKNLFIIGDVYE